MKTPSHQPENHESMNNGSTTPKIEHKNSHHSGSYKKLLWMMLISFVLMFFLMYAMIDQLTNMVFNINQFYMAGLMASPMLIVELVLMAKMYPDKKLNSILILVGFGTALAFFVSIRKQTAVGDIQFLKSMIPHHAGAILMVEESKLEDPEVKKLAEEIISAQNREIEFMKAKIKQLENNEYQKDGALK
ncbi:DUF305 domain-containing protein [Myroides ceti]|uniref:DUF305 domain-containing protein n=3 Tax=Bacteroidota TaxID=976 RepID=A0A1H6KJF4_9FLAO|nr:MULTISPECIES: DUF305 domain-containing protein [Bacteroidota]MCC2599450.1 DUF305 domain-containing protein [Sphingobacterium sp. FBM7-1]MDN3707273.1 DUF305 domain-containing protein [Paenimyroides ceti]MDN3708955.1 DUF305 domain-containing protein [Paenimyroides ceti]SEH71633.1 protein of unknown function [Paenimyroides aquimaris]